MNNYTLEMVDRVANGEFRPCPKLRMEDYDFYCAERERLMEDFKAALEEWFEIKDNPKADLVWYVANQLIGNEYNTYNQQYRILEFYGEIVVLVL